MCQTRIPAIGFLLPILSLISGCAELDALTSPSVKSALEDGALRDLDIGVGRDELMLRQARSILALPEPGDMPPAPSDEHPVMLASIGRHQAMLVGQLTADTQAICDRRGYPSSVRLTACDVHSQADIAFAPPVTPTGNDLQARGARIDRLVTDWWKSVCAIAPAVANPADAACLME